VVLARDAWMRLRFKIKDHGLHSSRTSLKRVKDTAVLNKILFAIKKQPPIHPSPRSQDMVLVPPAIVSISSACYYLTTMMMLRAATLVVVVACASAFEISFIGMSLLPKEMPRVRYVVAVAWRSITAAIAESFVHQSLISPLIFIQ